MKRLVKGAAGVALSLSVGFGVYKTLERGTENLKKERPAAEVCAVDLGKVGVGKSMVLPKTCERFAEDFHPTLSAVGLYDTDTQKVDASQSTLTYDIPTPEQFLRGNKTSDANIQGTHHIDIGFGLGVAAAGIALAIFAARREDGPQAAPAPAAVAAA